MCGIGLIVSGIQVDSSSIQHEGASPSSPTISESLAFTVEDLKVALRRRGPDSLGTKRVLLELDRGSPVEGGAVVSSLFDKEDETDNEGFCSDDRRVMGNCGLLGNGGYGFGGPKRVCVAEMNFIGAVLQLRGTNPVLQPMVDPCGNLLVFNGEIYGGIDIGSNANDTEVLMDSLGKCCCCCCIHRHTSTCGRKRVPELLSSLKGPWAMIYWQNNSKSLWFGRDAFGRRSLLVHWPTPEDPRLLFSSVSPPFSSNFNAEVGSINLGYWEELPCGVYSMPMSDSKANTYLIAQVKKHEWTNSMLKGLVEWERKLVEPKHEDLHASSCLIPRGSMQYSICKPADIALTALRESIFSRSIHNTIFQGESAPIAVLFSGGLDSMILAALLHESLGAHYDIELLNVSFEGQSAPDRITGRAGVEELKKFAPLRSWRLVEIDADLSNLTTEMKHVMSLIHPAKTYMDLNIGTALWLAASGHGWIYEANGNNNSELCKRVSYKSEARILLVGSGADEQCAGYGRHRTKYRSNSWFGLHREMKLDMQRIWKRNLGRDDRCISDHGKEARFPFLDEDVIRVLLDFPLWEIADLSQPTGTGDKKILREVARLLGLHETATLPKRAIQFGSRIAQESNRKNFGSNRAANMASAGSVEFIKSSS